MTKFHLQSTPCTVYCSMFNVNGEWAKKLITIRNEMNTFRRVTVHANDECQWNGVACVMRYALSNFWYFMYLINNFCWAFGNRNMGNCVESVRYTLYRYGYRFWVYLHLMNNHVHWNIRTKQGKTFRAHL